MCCFFVLFFKNKIPHHSTHLLLCFILKAQCRKKALLSPQRRSKRWNLPLHEKRDTYAIYPQHVAMETAQGHTASICKQEGRPKKKINKDVMDSQIVMVYGCYLRWAKYRWELWVLHVCVRASFCYPFGTFSIINTDLVRRTSSAHGGP